MKKIFPEDEFKLRPLSEDHPVWRAKHRPAPPPRYMTATVSTGDVAERVQATGAVQHRRACLGAAIRNS